MKTAIHQSGVVEYETQILNADGSVTSRRPRKRNLILDRGLDYLGGGTWASFFRYCAVGTGTTPTKRDSGAVTLSRVGDQVTASAGFFEAADVGRVIKWDTGEEDYVLAYTSPTVVTTRTSGAVAAAEATIWYVNQTAHAVEVARTGDCAQDAGANQTTFAVDTFTHQRTFLFPAVGAPVTYREIGWSNLNVAGANLNGRDLIPGAGDSLAAGQLYKVVVKLIVKVSPAAPVAVPNVGSGGYDTTGTAALEYIGAGSNGAAFSFVTATGASGETSNGSESVGLDPGSPVVMQVANAAFSQLAGPSQTAQFAAGTANGAMAAQAYTAGNFFRLWTRVFAVGDVNVTHHGFFFGSAGTNNGLYRSFSVKFTTPTAAKTSSHTLTVTFRKTWGRTLVN